MALTQISTAGVKDDAVTAGKIPANAVGSSEIAANAVGSSELADNAVDTAAIATDAVTTSRIADNSITTAKISDANVTNAKLANNAVTTSRIADNSVTSAKIADNAVVTAAINGGAVTNAKLAADAVTNAKIADDAIDSEHYVDGSIDEAHIASGAVTQTKIGDGSIINAKVDNAAAIAGTKISPDFGSQNVITDGNVKTGPQIITNEDGGGHMYLKNNSSGANYSSHFQTYSGGEGDNVQTHVHYYHGGYAELLHQGNSSVRTKSGGGVEFQNGNTKIGTYSTNGLAFGADTAAANSIHDYEYGSWTPTYAATGGVYGTLTYSVQTGQYVKIGRSVFVQFYINYTFGSVGGNFRIGGLPYSSNSYGAGAVMIGNHTLDQAKSYVLHTSNDSYLYLYGTEHGTAWASAGADASATIIGSFTYYTTS